jgi:hypothetical protein
MQETISISKFKATCLRLLDNVKKTGKSILVTRKGDYAQGRTDRTRYASSAATQTGSVVRLYEGSH